MAQLITAQQVINTCFTNKNTDVALVKDTFIEVAQQAHIRPVLGDDLYDEIVKQNNTSTLTAANTTLLETYIRPALAFFVKYEVLPDMLVNTTGKGLIVNNSEFGSAATSSQRAELSDTAKKHGDALIEKMIRYIEHKDQDGKYPLYSNDTDGTTVRGGIIF